MKCDNDSKCLNCFSYERLLRLTWDRNNNCTFISFVTSHILSHDSSVILCSFKREQSREKQFPPSLFNNFPDTKSTKDRMEYLNIWIGRRFDQSSRKYRISYPRESCTKKMVSWNNIGEINLKIARSIFTWRLKLPRPRH